MDYPGLGWLGHLGLWDGGQVAEVVNQSGNAIRFTSLSAFKTATTYWGAASANIPQYNLTYCFAPRCTNFWLKPEGQSENVTTRYAIAKRAYQSYLIGADYTLSAVWTPASPGDAYTPARRGIYRCDTFVIDTLGVTVQGSYGSDPHDPTWVSRYYSLYQGQVTPHAVFDKLKTFR